MAALVAIAAVMALCLVAVGLGRPVVASLDPRNRLDSIERLLAAGLLGVTFVALSVALVGALEYSTRSMALLLAGLAAIAAVLNRKLALPQRRFRWPADSTALWIVAGTFLLWVLVAAGAFAPPTDHDTMRYHASLMRRDLELGKIAVHYGWTVYEFMPPLAELAFRLVYALGGMSAAQALTSVSLAVAALSAVALALRLELAPSVAALAALLVIGQRVSVHLGAAVTVDFAVAAFFGIALSLALAWRREPTSRLAVLLGLVIGGLANVKYHGVLLAACLVAPLAYAALRGELPWLGLAKIAAIAALLLVPLLCRNAVVTGNPVFPMFHDLFGPGNVDIFAEPKMANRRGDGGVFLLTLPWEIFVNQLRFDGFQFGFPFLLLFAPFAFLGRLGGRGTLLAVILLYAVAWGVAMPHLLRFFVAVLPPLCVLAADGGNRVWLMARSLGPWAKGSFVALIGLGLGIQAMFVAATTVRRMPVVLGWENPIDYLEQAPFIDVTHIRACRFLEDHLRPGDSYLSLLREPTFYCPQQPMIVQVLPGDVGRLYKSEPLPALSATDAAQWLADAGLRYVLAPSHFVYDDHKLVFAKYRFDDLMQPALTRLRPVFETRSARIYDGASVIEVLRKEP